MDKVVSFFKRLFNKKYLGIILLSIYSSGRAQVVINEIMVNPSGANDGANMPNTAEWIELYNTSASSINIGCWFFTDGDFAVRFPSGTTIPAGGFYTIASASGSGLSPNLNWATCGCTTNNPGSNGSLSGNQVGIFTNGSEQVLLYNNAGAIQDAIIWGGGQLTTALTLTISAVGSCSSQTVTIPSSAASYENIGSHTDGIPKERDADGSSTWQNAGSATFGASNGGIVLPVELLSFEANNVNKQIEITWSTATETNTNYFVLEYSNDGFDFFDLQKLPAAGNSNSIVNYKYLDVFNENQRYYRLKQVDLDGVYSYSQLLYVENSLLPKFNIFPNPTETGEITIEVSTVEDGRFEVYNGFGKLTEQGIIGNEKYLIDLSKYGKGVYVVHLFNHNGSSFRKIIYE